MKTSTENEGQSLILLKCLLGRQSGTATALISRQKCYISAPTVSIPKRHEGYLCMFRKYREREKEGGREGERKPMTQKYNKQI